MRASSAGPSPYWLHHFPTSLSSARACLPVFSANQSRQGPQIAVFKSEWAGGASSDRSEEHTSELQSLMRTSYAFFCRQTNTQNTKTPDRTPATTPTRILQQACTTTITIIK